MAKEADLEQMELADAIKAESSSEEIGGEIQFADPDDEDGGLGEVSIGTEEQEPSEEVEDLADLDTGKSEESEEPTVPSEEEEDIFAGLDEEEEEDEGIPEELIQRAKKYGLTDQQIESFGDDPDKLVAAIMAIDTQTVQQAVQQQQQAQQWQQWQQWQQQQQQTAEGQENQESEDDEIKPIEFDEDMVDPGTAEVLQQMQDRYVEQLRRTKQRIEEMQNQLMYSQQVLQQMYAERQREAQVREVQSFDSALKSLPDEVKEKVGDGDFLAMNPSSPEYAERYRLFKTQAMLRQQHAAAGRQLSVEEAVQSAAMLLYPDTVKSQVKREFQSKVSRRRKQFSSRPNRRTKRSKKSRAQKALERFERWEAAQGMLD